MENLNSSNSTVRVYLPDQICSENYNFKKVWISPSFTSCVVSCYGFAALKPPSLKILKNIPMVWSRLPNVNAKFQCSVQQENWLCNSRMFRHFILHTPTCTWQRMDLLLHISYLTSLEAATAIWFKKSLLLVGFSVRNVKIRWKWNLMQIHLQHLQFLTKNQIFFCLLSIYMQEILPRCNGSLRLTTVASDSIIACHEKLTEWNWCQ